MSVSAEETVGDILDYLSPFARSSNDIPWPPDAFAITASLLKRSGAYREVANDWPPPEYADTSAWHEAIDKMADEWRKSCDANTATMPPQVKAWWQVVLSNLSLPVAKICNRRDLFVALVGIVAACDFACAGFGFSNKRTITAKEERANTNLSIDKTLCESIHRSRCIVLPKAHNPFTGMTLRSLTHNLALWDRPEVSGSWENILLDIPDREMNLLLVPWPMTIKPDAFHPAADCHELRLPDRVGLFDYDIPFTDADVDRIESLLHAAEKEVGNIHGVVLPELAMTPEQFLKVRTLIQDKLQVPLIVSGVGGTNPDRLGTNNVAISVHAELDEPYLQSKHHRWRIDEQQAKSYDLSKLPPKKENGAWWEGIEIENRSCIFFNANDWLTFCVLICEDLARQDPVSELVRSVGPTLVIALLLDAAQVPGRWPDRYATVLAEDPRSSVLTLTAAGLVDQANAVRGLPGARSIALWREAFQSASRAIILEPGAEGVVLKLGSKMSKEWTADGRHDDQKTGYLSLEEVVQIKP